MRIFQQVVEVNSSFDRLMTGLKRLEHPEMLDENRLLIERLTRCTGCTCPAIYAKQRVEVEKNARWRWWQTAFTTAYLANSFRTAYHLDTGNLHGVMSCLVPTGKFSGGELLVPRRRIAFALKPGDLLLFGPQEVHGNLPIRGERISAAFYCARGLSRRGAESGKGRAVDRRQRPYATLLNLPPSKTAKACGFAEPRCTPGTGS